MKDSANEKGERQPIRFGVRTALIGAKTALRRSIRWYNARLGKLYSPNTAAFTGTAIVLVMAVVLLFIPPYIGVADDGSLQDVMRGVGLGYRPQDLEAATGAYYVRFLMHSTYEFHGISTHRMLIRAAMWLDDQFTHDNLFDLRFMAAMYLALYLPAVFLVLRNIASRVKVAAEATFLVIIGALMLGDAATLACFSSLYPDAAFLVLMLYCMGFCMSMQHKGDGWMQLGFLGLMAAGSALALTERHCAMVGIVLTVFCMRQIRIVDRTVRYGILAVISASVLLAASVVGLTAGTSRFTEASHLHAMTNGVLLRSQNPENTLAEFDIEPRFETLADISAYEEYPYALSGNPEIQRDFMDRYSAGTIALHYVRHPFEYTGLLELGTRAAFETARNYTGNFERSAGFPEYARNGLLVFYSNFKANSLPRTLGFLAIVTVMYWALFRRQRGLRREQRRWTPRERQIMLDTFLCLLAAGILDISAVICISGTAELERYHILYGFCIDGMLMLFVAEILHRLNIISAEEQVHGG